MVLSSILVLYLNKNVKGLGEYFKKTQDKGLFVVRGRVNQCGRRTWGDFHVGQIRRTMASMFRVGVDFI